MHARCGLANTTPSKLRVARASEQGAQKISPQSRQWCLRRRSVKGLWHLVHALASRSGAHSSFDLAVPTSAFRVGIASRARQAADREGIDIKTYQVLYEVLEDVHNLMEGKLSPDFTEEITGHAHIKQVFKSSKFGNIAGCMILDGKINRNNKVRLLRDEQVVWTGELASVRREKEEVKDVREGFECGLLLKNYNDIKKDDVIESFTVHEVKRTLGSA